MPEKKQDFMLLAVHTDKEFTTWLQQHAEDGWLLKENRGNFFLFIKKPYDGKRICSYTIRSDVLGVSAEDVFYEQADDLRKNGWSLMAMGTPESFTDKTRHAFLTEVPREDLPHPEIPLSDPKGQTVLLQAALKKAASTLALCLIYAAILIYLIIFRPAMLFNGFPGTIFLAMTAIVLLPCVFFSIRAASLYANAVRDPETDSSMGDYQSVDRAVILCAVMLVILAAYMILDLLF